MKLMSQYDTPKQVYAYLRQGMECIHLIYDRNKRLLVGGSTLSWWGGLSTPGTLRAIPAVA